MFIDKIIIIKAYVRNEKNKHARKWQAKKKKENKFVVKLRRN